VVATERWVEVDGGRAAATAGEPQLAPVAVVLEPRLPEAAPASPVSPLGPLLAVPAAIVTGRLRGRVRRAALRLLVVEDAAAGLRAEVRERHSRTTAEAASEPAPQGDAQHRRYSTGPFLHVRERRLELRGVADDLESDPSGASAI
jgi:hypothetical protein